MFQVQPVRDRAVQAKLASLLGCEYFDKSYAFFAGELSDDCTTINALIALCQFTLDAEKSVIHSVAFAPGCEDDEAVFILVRTVMNYVYRAEIPYIAIDASACSADFIKKLGFREVGGEYVIDLKKFYLSPCHYNA